MNRIIRAFAAFIVSICLILAPPMAYANTSTWYPQSVVATGSTAIINAAKEGYRSTISHVPSAVSVGKQLVKGAGGAAIAYAMVELLDAGIDWVLDPANNAVKYTTQPTDAETCTVTGKNYSAPTREEMASGYCATLGYSVGTISGGGFTCAGRFGNIGFSCAAPLPVDNYIPIETVAAKVISNAAAGHVPSQDMIKDAATADVFAGILDNKLTDNQVVSDAPFDPTRPNDPQATPFDPSSIIAALQSVMSAINNMSSSIKARMETMLVELGVMQQETNQVINDGMADVVAANNATGARVGDVVAAIEALEGNTLDGQVINDAIDRVIAEGKTNTSDIVAAIEAIEGNTLDGQVINDAIDRVIANDNVNAQAAADAANTAADAAKAADAANTAAVTDAIGAQTDAITEADPVTGEMSLKFPKFCSWALPVCTFTDWAMADPQLEEPQDTRPEIQDLTKYDTVDISQNYVTATGQCPPAADLNINFGVVKLSYEPLCIILDKLSGVLVAVAYISVGFMIIRTV